jgi:hypothetical protein
MGEARRPGAAPRHPAAGRCRHPERPVTAWPIPWATIAADLAAPEARATSLEPAVLEARARVQARLERVRGLSGLQPNARAAWRSNQFWLRTFEDTPREDDEIRAGVSWMGDRFAARAQLSFVADPSRATASGAATAPTSPPSSATTSSMPARWIAGGDPRTTTR